MRVAVHEVAGWLITRREDVDEEVDDGVGGLVRGVGLLLVLLALYAANSLVWTRKMPAQNIY